MLTLAFPARRKLHRDDHQTTGYKVLDDRGQHLCHERWMSVGIARQDADFPPRAEDPLDVLIGRLRRLPHVMDVFEREYAFVQLCGVY